MTQLDPQPKRFGRMLFFSLWPDGGGFASYAAGWPRYVRSRPARGLRSVFGLAWTRPTRHATLEATSPAAPLRVHARYTREEIVAALDYAQPARKPNSFREGVLWAPRPTTDAFLVTLHKSEADYSPTTMYQDYAISPTSSTGSPSQELQLIRPPASGTSITRGEAATSCSSPANTRCTSWVQRRTSS